MKDEEILELLERIDKGYQPTKKEKAELQNVQGLTLRRTHIREVPESIGQLTNLRKLDLSGNPIRKVPESIGQLTNLQRLDLSGTQISTVPECIGQLANLQRLDLSDTQISKLPESIGQLENLQTLYLYSNQIQEVPKCIGQLTNLQKLDLSYTQISTVPECITQLTNLRYLDLSGTQISKLPECISQLPVLENLVIQNLKLHHIPASLALCGLRFNLKHVWDTAGGIFMKDTTLATQPVSLFEQSYEFIKDYFRQKQIPVNESKVIFLGDGEVGKSFTIKRIQNGGQWGDYKTKMTPGVDILDHHVGGERPFDIKFWDFGGQEIMHSMHRCFLTERTCYVVLVSTRLGSQTERARYWLRSIKSYAPNAPVLLVVNQWDGFPGGIDKESLYNEFPNLIRRVPELSIKSADEGKFAELMNAVIDMAGRMDSREMELPEKWNKIRVELLSLNQTKPYIDKEDYYRICRKNGLEEENMAAWLLKWFNDMGVCFSYHQDKETQKELERYKLLSPEWLTNAIYATVMEGDDFAERGLIRRSKIEKLLSQPAQMTMDKNGKEYSRTRPELTYSSQECGYILEIMEKFRLTYPVLPDEVEQETRYFIPALCSGNTPANLRPSAEKYPIHETYQMEYIHLPDTVLHRLMIFCFNRLQPKLCWQRGMVIDFTQSDGLRAIVTMEEDKLLKIEVYGTENCQPIWKLLQHLRSEILEINAVLQLKADDFILKEGKNGKVADISVDDLLEAWSAGERYIYAGRMRHLIESLLGPTYGLENIRKAQEQLDTEMKVELTPAVITGVAVENPQSVLPWGLRSEAVIEWLNLERERNRLLDEQNRLKEIELQQQGQIVENIEPNSLKEDFETANAIMDFIMKLPKFLSPLLLAFFIFIWYFFLR